MAKRVKDEEEDIPALNIEEIEDGEDIKLNVLVYGLTGSGKTRFVGSAQKCKYTSPILIIDVDGGLVTLSGSKIKRIRPQSFNELQDIYDFLRFENTTYKSVGIDGLTEVQRKLSMGEVVGTLEEDGSYTNLAMHTPADRYDWLSSGDQMRRFIRAFRDLAYLPDVERRLHVIFTALEREDDKHNIICPSLPGQLGIEVGASVDVLARLSIQRVEVSEDRYKKGYHMSLKETESEEGVRMLGKVRTPYESTSFPKEIWNPSVSKLMKYWLDRSSENNEPATKSKRSRKRRL